MDQNQIINAKTIIENYICEITTPPTQHNGEEFLRKRYEIAKEKFDKLMKDNPELAKEIIIKQVSNFHFYRLVKDRNLPQSWIEERKNLQTEIIQNFQKYSLQQVQNAICDLYFRDIASNLSINLLTLKDREGTEGNKKYNEKLAIYKDLFDITSEFISLKEASPEEIQGYLNQIIQLARPLLQQGPIFKAVRDLLDLEEKDFTAELTAYLGFSKKTMFKGIEPEIIKTEENREVKFFTLKNQTKSQSSFQLLVHSMAIEDWMYGPQALDEYESQIRKQYACCYSLIDQSINQTFCQKYRITFGYLPENLENADIIACGIKDMQTNQFKFLKNITYSKQDFYPIPEFLKKTRAYNEIALKSSGFIPKPDYILIQSDNPSEEIIKIASVMQIPIIYIDPNAYEKYTAPEPLPYNIIKNLTYDGYFQCLLENDLCLAPIDFDRIIE